MEPLGDGLQLVGFLVVTAMVLASLVAVAIGITVFLYMTDRKIVIFKKRSSSHEPGRKHENIPAEAQSSSHEPGRKPENIPAEAQS